MRRCPAQVPELAGEGEGSGLEKGNIGTEAGWSDGKEERRHAF